MRHEIDRHSMMNDIILTVALLISLAIVTVISHVMDLYQNSNKLFIFIGLTFVLVKVFYNGIIHAIKVKNKYFKGTR